MHNQKVKKIESRETMPKGRNGDYELEEKEADMTLTGVAENNINPTHEMKV